MSQKILFLSNKFHPDIGGIEVNSEILASAFHKAGYEVRLITWTRTVDSKTFPFNVVRNPTLGALLSAHYWADLVYENNPCLRLAWPAVFFNKPTVVALRTWINRIDGSIGWQDKLKVLWLKRAAAVIAVSNAVRTRCWPKATVIGNPFRENVFQIRPAVARDSDFVFLGRLVSDKGADLALKALACLLSKTNEGKLSHSGLSLTIIGNGPEDQYLKELIVTLGIEKSVSFTGALRGEELVSCLNRHKYLLVPSAWEEPFGNVALEGMACGCIPIVADGGGLPDAVGNAGLVFKRGSVESLVACIEKILQDKGLEQRLRDAAPNHLEAHYPEVVAKKYLEVIEKALKM